MSVKSQRLFLPTGEKNWKFSSGAFKIENTFAIDMVTYAKGFEILLSYKKIILGKKGRPST